MHAGFFADLAHSRTGDALVLLLLSLGEAPVVVPGAVYETDLGGAVLLAEDDSASGVDAVLVGMHVRWHGASFRSNDGVGRFGGGLRGGRVRPSDSAGVEARRQGLVLAVVETAASLVVVVDAGAVGLLVPEAGLVIHLQVDVVEKPLDLVRVGDVHEHSDAVVRIAVHEVGRPDPDFRAGLRAFAGLRLCELAQA